MKIKIIDKNEKKRLTFILPTSLVKSKLIWRIVKKHSPEAYRYYQIVKPCYQALKKYIKENGHFILVEVKSNDGDYVKIKV